MGTPERELVIKETISSHKKEAENYLSQYITPRNSKRWAFMWVGLVLWGFILLVLSFLLSVIIVATITIPIIAFQNSVPYFPIIVLISIFALTIYFFRRLGKYFLRILRDKMSLPQKNSDHLFAESIMLADSLVADRAKEIRENFIFYKIVLNLYAQTKEGAILEDELRTLKDTKALEKCILKSADNLGLALRIANLGHHLKRDDFRQSSIILTEITEEVRKFQTKKRLVVAMERMPILLGQNMDWIYKLILVIGLIGALLFVATGQPSPFAAFLR